MNRHSPPAAGGPLPGATGTPPRVWSVAEKGLPILTVVRGRHGSGRREVGGGLDVPVIVALSAIHQVERRTQAGVLRKSPVIGAVTVADPAERTVFTVDGEADVLQISISMRLIEEVADAPVRAVRSLFNEHDPAIERSAMGALVALRDGSSHSDLLLHSIGHRLADILGQPGAGAPSGVPRRGGITSPALQRIHDLVQARLDEPVPASPTLDELARAAGISKHHFIKAFREVVGETPYAWVVRQRIERVRQRLGVTPGVFKEAVLG